MAKNHKKKRADNCANNETELDLLTARVRYLEEKNKDLTNQYNAVVTQNKQLQATLRGAAPKIHECINVLNSLFSKDQTGLNYPTRRTTFENLCRFQKWVKDAEEVTWTSNPKYSQVWLGSPIEQGQNDLITSDEQD